MDSGRQSLAVCKSVRASSMRVQVESVGLESCGGTEVPKGSHESPKKP